MAQTSKGLYYWPNATDRFRYSELSQTILLINDLLDAPANSVEILAALPTTDNFAGRLVMLSAANASFPAWTLVQYNGSSWKNAGAIEVLPALPTTELYPGRIVVLSASVGGFTAWDVVRYDGAAWDILGGWRNVNTGAGATNIQGLQANGDVYVANAARGVVLVDRQTGTKRRLYLDGGNIENEVVT